MLRTTLAILLATAMAAAPARAAPPAAPGAERPQYGILYTAWIKAGDPWATVRVRLTRHPEWVRWMRFDIDPARYKGFKGGGSITQAVARVRAGDPGANPTRLAGRFHHHRHLLLITIAPNCEVCGLADWNRTNHLGGRSCRFGPATVDLQDDITASQPGFVGCTAACDARDSHTGAVTIQQEHA